MKKNLVVGLVGLLCAASLASCGNNASAASVKELYAGGETSAGVIAAITNYTSLQLELMSDNTYVYNKFSNSGMGTTVAGITNVTTYGSFAKGTSSDGYTPITLKAATRVVFDSFSDLGGYATAFDTDTNTTYPVDVGNNVKYDSKEAVLAAYGAEITVYAQDGRSVIYTKLPE